MLDATRTKTAALAANPLQWRLAVALAAVGLIVLFSQIATQWLLAGQQQDAHVVNIAGRQRMLSQEIAKASYRLISSGTGEARQAALAELRDALAQFQRAHAGLQRGDSGLDLPSASSTQIARLFDNVEPDYQAFAAAASSVINAADRPGEVYQAVQRLSEHEAAFLTGMDAIVFQYDAEAGRRVVWSRWIGLGFGLLTLTALGVVASRMFMPAIAGLQAEVDQRARQSEELERLIASAPVALILVDPANLAIVQANGRGEALLGSAGDDLIGHSFLACFDTRLDASKTLIARVRAGEAFHDQEVLLINTRHEALEVLASMRRVDHAGQRRYLVSLADLTRATKH